MQKVQNEFYLFTFKKIHFHYFKLLITLLIFNYY